MPATEDLSEYTTGFAATIETFNVLRRQLTEAFNQLDAIAAAPPPAPGSVVSAFARYDGQLELNTSTYTVLPWSQHDDRGIVWAGDAVVVPASGFLFWEWFVERQPSSSGLFLGLVVDGAQPTLSKYYFNALNYPYGRWSGVGAWAPGTEVAFACKGASDGDVLQSLLWVMG